MPNVGLFPMGGAKSVIFGGIQILKYRKNHGGKSPDGQICTNVPFFVVLVTKVLDCTLTIMERWYGIDATPRKLYALVACGCLLVARVHDHVPARLVAARVVWGSGSFDIHASKISSTC